MQFWSVQALRILFRQLKQQCRLLCVLLLVLSVLAPKVSLALVSLFGNGYYTTIICSGAHLQRVTISPSGEIVDTDALSQEWVSPDCALTIEDVESLQRQWHSTAFPATAHALRPLTESHRVVPLFFLSQLTNRGPPVSWF